MIGKTISHYKILEKLGEGGMGVVYKAEDTTLDRLVALKFLPEQFSINEAEKKRFIHEAKAAAALDHPHICAVYEIDETDDGRMFIVMAYYEGETLRDKVDRGQIETNRFIELAIQMSEGVREAHINNIIHRDIKNRNSVRRNVEIVIPVPPMVLLPGVGSTSFHLQTKRRGQARKLINKRNGWTFESYGLDRPALFL